jgi:uncharacterized membrane protein YhaH (DUF805 family)
MGIFHQYFGFSGRINRGRFWLLSILLIVFSILAWVVAFLVALFILGVNVTDGSLPGLDQPDKLVRMILHYAVAFIVLLGVAIAIWVSWFAIGVKRLHDRDKSGWWIVVFYILPWIVGSKHGGQAGKRHPDTHPVADRAAVDALGHRGARFSARHPRTEPFWPRSAAALGRARRSGAARHRLTSRPRGAAIHPSARARSDGSCRSRDGRSRLRLPSHRTSPCRARRRCWACA